MQKKIWRMLFPLLVYVATEELVFAFWELRHGRVEETQVLLLTALASVLSVLFLSREYGRSQKGRKPGKLYPPAYFAVAGIGGCLFLNGLLRLLPIPEEGYEQVGRALYRPSFLIQLACMGVLVPLGEELVFRGLFYGRLREEMSCPKAAALSALCFGLLHGNLIQGIYAGTLGIFLALIYEYEQGLRGCWLFHGAANGTAVCMTYVFLGGQGAVGQAAMAAAGGILLLILYNTIRRDGIRK